MSRRNEDAVESLAPWARIVKRVRVLPPNSKDRPGEWPTVSAWRGSVRWFMAPQAGAGARQNNSRVFLATPAQTFPEVSTKLSGFSAAGGLEYAFTHNVIGRLQYDFYDFGSSTFAAPAISDTVAVDIKTKVHTVTAGVAWKFDWAALR